HHAAVAEKVVFTLDQLPGLAGVEIGGHVTLDVATLLGGIHLGSLHDDGGVGQQCVASAVVEVQVGVDDVGHRCRVDVDRGEPRGDVFACAVVELVDRGQHVADVCGGVALRVDVQPAVEDDPAAGMLDQVRGDRYPRRPLPAGEQERGGNREVA